MLQIATYPDLVWKFKILKRVYENTNVQNNQNASDESEKRTLKEFDLELGRK